jgi:hypothetical protein
MCGRHVACSSRAIASRRQRHSVPRLPSGAALCQLGWGELLRSVDGTGRARLVRSRRAGCCRAALPSASSAGPGGDCRAWTALACSSRASATRRRRHLVLPGNAALRQRSWGGWQLSADGTGPARLARSRRSGACPQCCRAAIPSASSAGPGGGDCRALTSLGVLVSRERDAQAAALGAAWNAALRQRSWGG